MKEDLTGIQIVILGFARQGMAFARFAAQSGAKVIVSDLRSAEQMQKSMVDLHEFDIEYVLGDHPMSLLEGTDLLVISGGVAADLPLVEVGEPVEIAVPEGIVGVGAESEPVAVGIAEGRQLRIACLAPGQSAGVPVAF